MTGPKSDLARLPKVELHLHLEGAAPPAFIRGLAAEKGVDLSAIFDADGGYRWADFAEFLRTYEAACTVLQSPRDFCRLVEAVLAASAADGVIYTEIFLAPDLCGGGSPAAWPEYLAAMIEGADSARRASGIETRFIPTAIRHFGPERALRAARLAAETAGAVVTGFGMGGDERDGHLAEFASAFELAAEAGLGLTVHAGEVCGPQSIRDALDHLSVSRIGHGVRAIEEPALVSRLAEEGIVLEVNPGSNVALGVYPDWRSHPIDRLRRAGVNVTVSTDDPPYFHTGMIHEYAELASAFGWTSVDFAAINRTALRAAFCDEKTRERLLARVG
ncbi:adenosine deaminase [Amaricoccus sp. B4]|uniref:adenosine deaminase n=1 Tax=Amaricoccus sp. B4 TaxID=3368557 RepID=UPI003712F2C7